MLLKFISLHIPQWCQGQRFPLLKGNLRASFLSLPSRWHYTCRLEMFRKHFPLYNREKHFPSAEPAPTFSPSLNGIWCFFFSQIIHDWSLALFVLLLDTVQWADKDGAQWRTRLCVSAGFLSNAPAGFQLPYKPASESACFRLQSRLCQNIAFKIIITLSIKALYSL